MLAVLRIAHKYNMELVEEDILSHLKTASTTPAYVDLMVGSQIVNPQVLYHQALQGLVNSDASLGIVEARIIGVDAYHAVMLAREKGPRPPNQRVWVHCASHTTTTSWNCSQCRKYQG